jgi:hypothetical protein
VIELLLLDLEPPVNVYEVGYRVARDAFGLASLGRLVKYHYTLGLDLRHLDCIRSSIYTRS